MNKPMTTDEVHKVIRDARKKDAQPDLRNADLWGADLRYEDLRYADLRGTNLRGADLRGTKWGGLYLSRLPSGDLYLIPTPDGWHLQIGCWKGTPNDLRDLIARDEGWPEAEGAEIQRRRPLLETALALCEAHMKDRAHIIEELRERWGHTDVGEEAA